MNEGSTLKVAAKHTLAIRWFHWINFPVLSLMVWSGLLIYWSNDEYMVKLGGKELFHFFPDVVYDKLHIGGRLAEGMGWHFLLMWVFTLNGLLYVLFLALSGEWRYLVPQKGTLKSAIHTVLHDLHLRKDPPPPGKFNGAQQIAYTSIVIMGAVAVLTGIAIFKPVQTGPLVNLLGGYHLARIIHFLLMLGFVGFFFIHVSQVVKAGWNNFRAMVTGFELTEDEHGIA